MFNPPDYPYKEQYGQNDLLFNIRDTLESLVPLETADNAFPITNINEAQSFPDMYIVQSDDLFNYEPTLLDDNTVNQFLLPLQGQSDESVSI